MAEKGFVHAQGKQLVDGEGKPFQIRGVNLGNWLVPECYMALAGVGDFETGVYTVERSLRAMQANPNLKEEQIGELYHLYARTYTTEKDFETIASVGLNTVRLPFTWRDLTTDGITLKPDGFLYLDWAVQMCEKYGLYVILDLHGAIGSQNQDFHSGEDGHFDLYGNEENERKTVELRKKIAGHYRGNPCVLGYDLLNECRRAPGKFGGRVNSDFYDVLYQAVREVDPDHLIFIEYFTFPIHGRGACHYRWENVAVEYHIYNLTPFSQKNCLRMIRAMHQVSGNTRLPVYIGEFNAWDRVSDWDVTLDFFDRLGWSWSSWCYKANEYPYRNPPYTKEHAGRDWGLYVLDRKPVDLSTATFEEIKAAYEASGTENARPTYIYDFYKLRLGR